MADEKTKAQKKYVGNMLGVSGLSRWGGYVSEEFNPDLRWPRAAKVYKEMADNDAVIGAVLYLAEMQIRGVKWHVKPAGDSQEDKDNAKFVEECMHDMENSWAEFITEVLSMMTYGFDVHEIVYKLRLGPKEKNPKKHSKYSDGRIGWRKFGERAQSSLLEWEFDEEGNLTAFIQLAPPLFERTRIPINKMMLFRTRVHKNNPEGKSLLRNAYRSWYFKKRIEEIEAIGIERDLAGLPTLTAPPDVDIFDEDDEDMKTAKQNALDILVGVRNDSASGVLLNDGWKFELASTGGSRQFDTNAIITRYDYRIAASLLSDIILMGSEKSGSFALADTKKDLMCDALEAMLMNICDVINKKAVVDLFNLNGIYPESGYPEITADHIKKLTAKDIALVLRGTGIAATKDIRFYNLVCDVCNVDKVEKEEFEKMFPKIDPNEMKNPEGVDQGGANAFEDTSDNDLKISDSHNMTGGK